jgi:hypothetical protein
MMNPTTGPRVLSDPFLSGGNLRPARREGRSPKHLAFSPLNLNHSTRPSSQSGSSERVSLRNALVLGKRSRRHTGKKICPPPPRFAQGTQLLPPAAIERAEADHPDRPAPTMRQSDRASQPARPDSNKSRFSCWFNQGSHGPKFTGRVMPGRPGQFSAGVDRRLTSLLLSAWSDDADVSPASLPTLGLISVSHLYPLAIV